MIYHRILKKKKKKKKNNTALNLKEMSALTRKTISWWLDDIQQLLLMKEKKKLSQDAWATRWFRCCIHRGEVKMTHPTPVRVSNESQDEGHAQSISLCRYFTSNSFEMISLLGPHHHCLYCTVLVKLKVTFNVRSNGCIQIEIDPPLASKVCLSLQSVTNVWHVNDWFLDYSITWTSMIWKWNV